MTVVLLVSFLLGVQGDPFGPPLTLPSLLLVVVVYQGGKREEFLLLPAYQPSALQWVVNRRNGVNPFIQKR